MKIRRCLTVLLVCLFAMLGVLSLNTRANVYASNADGNLSEEDSCFLETYELTLGNYDALSYSKYELYDYNLESFGYEYRFSQNNSCGFALMIKRAAYYEITEIYSGKQSPYVDISGLPVYLTILSYIEYKDDCFYDIESNIILEENILLELQEKGFGYKGGGTPIETVTESVTYTSKDMEENKFSSNLPIYYNENPDLHSICAVNAGSVVMGYYGRYFPELMPNFTVGRMLGSYYYYNKQLNSVAVQAVINTLYTEMGTNIGGSGTTSTGFRNGLVSYAASKGKTVTYTNVVTNNTLNYALYKNNIDNLKPIVLFLNTYNLIGEYSITTSGNTDYITKTYYGGLHVVISYGYKRVMYYSGGTHFRTDYFLRIYTGDPLLDLGYIKLYDRAVLQEGYAINIY